MSVQQGIPVGEKRETPVLTITDEAVEKIRTVLGQQDPPVEAIRVSSPVRGRYSMQIEPEGNPAQDDTVLPYEGFKILIDGQSVANVDGATLNWLETYGGGGFQFTAGADGQTRERKEAPEGPEGEIWRQVQQLLDDEVNPGVASHGGHIELIEVNEGTVYVEMQGGCQGCSQSKMTLKSGIERMLKEKIPSIDEVLDVTDHAGGRNPYYTA